LFGWHRLGVFPDASITGSDHCRIMTLSILCHLRDGFATSFRK
jgi:hypothetical protein